MSGYSTVYIRTFAVLCADDDGSNDTAQNIDPKAIEIFFQKVNTYFQDVGIVFLFNRHIDVINENQSLLNQDFSVPNSANLHSINPPMTDAEIHKSKLKHKEKRDSYARERSGHLIVFFRSGTNLKYNTVNNKWEIEPATYAFSGADNEFVAMGTNAEVILFAHEAGHYFHLWHTHSGNTGLTRKERDKYPDPKNNPADLSARRDLITNKVRKVIRDYIDTGRPSEDGQYALDVDGPVVKDTPPDPGHEFFIYYGHQSDEHSVTIDVPLATGSRYYTLFPDKDNIMSYFFREPGTKHFSGQQTDRMRRTLELPVSSPNSLSRQHLITRPTPIHTLDILAKLKWGKDWSHMVPYDFLSGHPYLIAYSLKTGEVHFDHLNDNGRGITILNKGKWSKWTHLDTFSLGQDRYLLVYNVASGDVRFDKLRTDGSGSDNVWHGKWAPGWTHIIPIGINTYNRDHLLVYNASTGAVRIDRFGKDANGSTNLWHGKWGIGWSHIMLYRVDGKSWRFLIYNKTTGLAHFDQLDDPINGSKTIFKQNWSPGWSHFMPYPTSLFDTWPAAKFIAYNSTTGIVHFDEVSDDSFKVHSNEKWGAGWTTFIPSFLTGVNDGSEGFIAYNSKSGECHFDRLL